MKRFWGFIKKEFYHITRDYRTMIILFGMPVVQLLLFGYVITNEIKDVKVAVFDQSKDNNSSKITDKILSSGYFKLNENIDHLGDIEKSFRKGSVKEVIVYEKDFTEKLESEGSASIQLIADASEPNTANLIVNYTSGIIASYNKELNKTVVQPEFIKPEVRMYYNAELKGVFMFVPGLMALLLTLISALMTSISITREKELGTMEVLLVSPLKPIQIIIGKVMPYVAMSFINAVMILLIANLVFEVPVRGSVVLLLSECLLYILVALSLGILISTSTNSQQVAMMMSMVGLMLPAILLSGFIFPIENMPVILQVVCQIMPPRWFISIIKAIMLKGAGFMYVWKETLVLVFMLVFFIGLSVKKFKVRLE
jgi:ABC-2 type transport system permease protein